jgi:protein TonB
VRAFLIVLLLVPSAAIAKDVEPATPGVRAAWAKDLRAAKDLYVAHSEFHRRPAPFKSALPCEYQYRVEHAKGMLDEKRRRPLLAFLASVVEQEPQRPTTTCADLSQDEIEFRSGSLRFRYQPGMRRIYVEDRGSHIESHDLRGASDSLMALLRATIRDTRLPAIADCSGSVPVSDSPDQEQFVLVDEVPEAVVKVPPDYPDDCRARGLQGVVVVQVRVAKDGLVERTKVVASTESPLDQAAVLAVEQWRFKPGRTGGEPVAVWVAVPVKFSLH